MRAHEVEHAGRQLRVGAQEGHHRLVEAAAARQLLGGLAVGQQLLVEHRAVVVGLLLAALVLLVAEPGGLAQRQALVDLGQQRVERAVHPAGLHPGPAVADDVAPRRVRVRDHMDRIVLTLRTQVVGALADHALGVDLARRQRVGVDQVDGQVHQPAPGRRHRAGRVREGRHRHRRAAVVREDESLLGHDAVRRRAAARARMRPCRCSANRRYSFDGWQVGFCSVSGR